jgi:hypothetical protein
MMGRCGLESTSSENFGVTLIGVLDFGVSFIGGGVSLDFLAYRHKKAIGRCGTWRNFEVFLIE